MSATKPIPAPWKSGGVHGWSDLCKDRGSLFDCSLKIGTHIPIDQNRVNAARICLCVNSHDALVEALRLAVGIMEHLDPNVQNHWRSDCEKIARALELAEPKPERAERVG